MTKLTNMNLPKRGTAMHLCKTCREWVPSKDKHNRKNHKEK